MRRITGKFMAAVLSAVMTLSPLAGGLTVYADELEAVGLEDIAGDALVEEDDTADPAPADGDLIIEEDAEDIMSEEAAEDTVDDATAEGSDLAADGSVNPPVTGGRSIRLASYGTGMQKNQHIYFGTMDEDNYSYSDEDKEHRPYWRVLDPAGDNAGGKGIFVMSEALWGNKKVKSYVDPDEVGIVFNNDTEDGNLWYDKEHGISCKARDWCGNYLTTNFSLEEQRAIKAVSKTEETGEAAGQNWKKCYLKDDRIFFLSAQEVCDYLDDDYYSARYLDDKSCKWMLRSGNYEMSSAVGYAYNYIFSTWTVSEKILVRPAFNLDPSSILLTSAAEGGKPSGAVGPDALKAVENKSIKDWKLTIIDKTRSFSAGRVDSGDVVPGGSITVQYSGAYAGDREYVSAILCDNSGNVLYYGRLANDSQDGTTKVTIPRNLPAGNTYQLYVFSEYANDDYRTDYASAPSKISLRVPFQIKNTTLSPASFKYNGKVQIPSVMKGNTKLKEGVDYTKVIRNSSGNVVKSPINAGTYRMVITGSGNYTGTATKSYTISKVNVKDTTLKPEAYKYNGKVQIPSVLSGNVTLKKGTDYSLTIKNEDGKSVSKPKNAGTYKMVITGKGNYTGTATKQYKINKLSNTLKVSKKSKNAFTYKQSELKKRSKNIKESRLYVFSDRGKGKLTYTVSYAKKGGKSYKNKFKVSSKGKLTVKKGLGKGTYTVKIKVKAKGNKNYKSKTVTLKYKIKVTK